jgi:hypothetical protein
MKTNKKKTKCEMNMEPRMLMHGAHKCLLDPVPEVSTRSDRSPKTAWILPVAVITRSGASVYSFSISSYGFERCLSGCVQLHGSISPRRGTESIVRSIAC